MYHFLRYRYESIDIVFISHTTEAWEVSEENFFTRSNSGGTILSSGLELCLNIINKRYHPDNWNIYTFHCSDGENWSKDNEKAIDMSSTLKKICQLYGYVQVIPGSLTSWQGEMSSKYEHLIDDSFKIVKLYNKEDIWPEFKRIFGGKIDE